MNLSTNAALPRAKQLAAWRRDRPGLARTERHHRAGAVDIGNARRSLDAGGRGRGQLGKKEIDTTRVRFEKSSDRWRVGEPHARPTRGLWRIDTTRGCDATGARRSPHGAHSALGARSCRPSSPRRRLSPRKCGEARVESEALSPREKRAGSCSFSEATRSREIAGSRGTRARREDSGGHGAAQRRDTAR